MSFRVERIKGFQGQTTNMPADYLGHTTDEEVTSLFHKVLGNGMHGLCYSIYEAGQKPGDVITEAQVRKRLEILKPHTNWIRSFSCIEGNEWVPKVAKDLGMKTLVGAWLGTDAAKNLQELEALVALAKKGLVDIAAVGNEVLYRGEMSEQELLGHINTVKAQLPGIPVGYVDAYYEFDQHPEIADACDVILCNCYPYWEETAIEFSLQHMQSMYQTALEAAKGKPVVITETGWPSQGQGQGGAQPSAHNAMRYFVNTQLWASDQGIQTFYFSSFDEAWKVDAEGDVGAYWGIWDSEGKLKY